MQLHISALVELPGCERMGVGGRLGAVRTKRGKEVRLQIANAEDENVRTWGEKCRSEGHITHLGFFITLSGIFIF